IPSEAAEVQRGGAPLHVFSLKRLVPVSRVCPVATLEAYLLISDQFRKGIQSDSLFLSLRAPHHSVGASTLSRWLKATLEETGIDTSIYSAHSTRGASASKAADSGMSIEGILRMGSWSSESTFTRFYRRQIELSLEANTLVLGR
ncbi:Tyrosine recombinase-like protein, partial [Daphnia magna]